MQIGISGAPTVRGESERRSVHTRDSMRRYLSVREERSCRIWTAEFTRFCNFLYCVAEGKQWSLFILLSYRKIEVYTISEWWGHFARVETLKRRKIIFIYKRIQFVNHSLFTTVSGYRIYMGFCEEKYVNKFCIILFFTFIQFRKTHYVDAISSNFRNERATVHPSRKRINSSACSGRNKGSKGGSPNPRRIESVSSSAAFYLAFSHRIINERPRAQDR